MYSTHGKPPYPRSGATGFQVPWFTAQFFFTQWTHYIGPIWAVTDVKPAKEHKLLNISKFFFTKHVTGRHIKIHKRR